MGRVIPWVLAPALACLVAMPRAAWAERGTEGTAASVWSDSFPGFGRSSFTRHLVLRPEGGVILTPAVQNWSWPADERFSAGELSPGVAIMERGTVRETMVLWQKVLEPGVELSWAQKRLPGEGGRNGILYRENPLTPVREGFSGFPGYGRRGAPGVGWDTARSGPQCLSSSALGELGGISVFNGKPLLWGGGMAGLSPGTTYTASFTAAARHDGFAAPYIGFEWVERSTGKAAGSWTAEEPDLSEPDSPDFASFSRFTVALDPAPDIPGAVWDVQATAQSGTESHCTLLGPVYVNAQEGEYASPVFDSLSPLTVWERIEWEVEQNYGTADPDANCATPGNPITPVVLRVGLSDDPSPVPGLTVPFPLPDAGDMAFPGNSGGRYLRVRASLHGRDSAGKVATQLSPKDAHRHFSGWKPSVRRISVRYRPKAGRVVSARIAPASLKKWGKVFHRSDAPGASLVRVDVISPDGTVLFEDVPSGFDLAGRLDPFDRTAIHLRADLIGDVEVPDARPALVSWSIHWTPLPEKLVLDRATLSTGRGEWVRGLVAVESAGRIRVRVHDGKGREVAVPLEGDVRSESASFRWNGHGSDGAAVKPGNYFITATTRRGAGTRKIRVEQ